MRRAALVAVVLLLSALAGVPHASASPAACADGFDNDGDGAADWPADTGCSGPGDVDERPCGLDRPGECVQELQPCPGMLPPTGLHATWTDHGVALDWTEPLSGAPPVYLVFRVPLDSSGPAGAPGGNLPTVEVQADPAILGHRVAHPDAGLPAQAVVQLPARGGIAVTPPLDAEALPPEPIASIPGSQTSYFDASADPAAAYVYWVEGAAPGCRGPASNAATSGLPLNIPPRIEDCWWPQPPDLDWPPSSDCLGNFPWVPGL